VDCTFGTQCLVFIPFIDQAIAMACLTLMVGLPGSGKTTRAKELEVEHHMLRLTPDEWVEPLYGPGLSGEKLDAVRDPIEAVQWQVARRALQLGVDVVLDFGFWSRTERQSFRERAAEVGAETKLCYLPVAFDELTERLERRNASLPPHTFHISREQILLWWSLFEPPDEEEMR
jgi:predicted kinase